MARREAFRNQTQVCCVKHSGLPAKTHRAGLLAVYLSVLVSSCCMAEPPRQIYKEDTNERFLLIETTTPTGYLSGIAHEGHKVKLENYLRELRGDLTWVFREMHGVDNPRIVVDTDNRQFYRVVYSPDDQQALAIVAEHLNLAVAKEERQVGVVGVHVGPGGHHLAPATGPLKVEPERLASDSEGKWPLQGATMDQLARFLETRYRVPVVDVTGIKGRWSLLLSGEAADEYPKEPEKVIPLDSTGLELRREKIKIPVTVIKDKRSNKKPQAEK